MKPQPIICLPYDLLKGLKHVDEAFSGEMEFFVSNKYDIAIIDLENRKIFYDGTARAFEQDFAGREVLYWGWMLNEEDYRLMESMVAKRHGSMRTSVDQYLKAHHLPHWIDTFQHDTAETRVYPLSVTPESIMEDVPEWGGYFIKDYVKSHYGHRKARNRVELRDICRHLMENENLQKGLVVRQECTSFIHGTKEIRCWWTPKGWFVATHPQHQDENSEHNVPLDYLEQLSNKLHTLGVEFVSVDLYWDIELSEWKLIEIGDGQVSGVGNLDDLKVIAQLL